jgi:hypothetical protein
MFDTYEKFYSKISDSMYAASLSELERIYEYNQEYVRSSYFLMRYSKYMTRHGYIRLARGVSNRNTGYAGNIVYLKNKAELQGQATIEIETDIVSFYAVRPYAAELSFYVEIPIENILIYDCAVTLQDIVTPYREHEFIVFNPNPRGSYNVDILDIHYDPVAVLPIVFDENLRRHGFYLPDSYTEIIVRKSNLEFICDKISSFYESLFKNPPSDLFIILVILLFPIALGLLRNFLE